MGRVILPAVNRTISGLLKGLLCALLLALPSLPAWAIARPENRVGGSPVFLSIFASQETAKRIEPPQENPTCGYDFASGMHKYLYCKANPVNGEDPDGHDDIGDVLGTMDIGFSLAAMTGPSISATKAVSIGSTSGPDVTRALDATLDNVNNKLRSLSRTDLLVLTANLTNPYWGVRWDIDPLYELGRGTFAAMMGGVQGTGLGERTVQLSYRGGPLRTYPAGAVNYILWGRVWRFCHNVFPYTPTTLPVAEDLVSLYKLAGSARFGWDSGLITAAKKFTECGYNFSDPSDVALPLPSNPSNVAKVSMLQPWEFEWLMGP